MRNARHSLFSTCDTPRISSLLSRRGVLYEFCTFACSVRPTAGSFARSRLRGTHGGRLSTRRKFGLRSGSVACSGRLNSREPASNHGIALRGARTSQDIGKRTFQLLGGTDNHHYVGESHPPCFRPCVSHFLAACVLNSTPPSSHEPACNGSKPLQQRLLG